MGEKKRTKVGPAVPDAATAAKLEAGAAAAREAEEPHEYTNPTHGRCGVCGSEVNSAIHLSAAWAEPKKPLAEIRERDFVYAREVLSGVPMATALLNSVTALYNKAAADGYTPADATLAIKISPSLPSEVGVPQTRLTAKVTGWKAVEL